MKKSDVRHIPIKGDGNCLFHSIVKYLELDRKYGYSDQIETHNKLRLKCVDWLRKNLNLKTGSGVTIRDQIQFFVDDDNKLKSVEDYLRKMRKNKTYGGQVEIFAISHLLNRNIKTYIDKGNKYSSIGLGNEVKQLRSHDTINLYHNIKDVGSDEENMFHFEILYPRYKKHWKPKDKKKSESTHKKKSVHKKKLGVKLEKKRSIRRKRSSRKRTTRRTNRTTRRTNRTIRRINRRTNRTTRRTNRRTNRNTRRTNRRRKLSRSSRRKRTTRRKRTKKQGGGSTDPEMRRLDESDIE